MIFDCFWDPGAVQRATKVTKIGKKTTTERSKSPKESQKRPRESQESPREEKRQNLAILGTKHKPVNLDSAGPESTSYFKDQSR